MKKIYIVLTHSGTYFSQIIKFFTKFEYTHVSISFDKNIEIMYSFGRKKYNNPLNSGFVKEYKNGVFYKKYSKTRTIILELQIENKKFDKLNKILNKFKNNSDRYGYDIVGLPSRIINIKINRKNHFVCSEFIGYLLESANIYKFKKDIIKPIDFMNIPNIKIIYEGKLKEY